MNTKVEEALADAMFAAEKLFDGGYFVAGERAHQARTTLAAHIAQQDATIARMREALDACLDYGSMTDDGWVTDKARAALTQGEVK